MSVQAGGFSAATGVIAPLQGTSTQPKRSLSKKWIIVVATVLAVAAIVGIIIMTTTTTSRRPALAEAGPVLLDVLEEAQTFEAHYRNSIVGSLYQIEIEELISYEVILVAEEMLIQLNARLDETIFHWSGIGGVDEELFISTKDDIRTSMQSYRENLTIIRHLTLGYIAPIITSIFHAYDSSVQQTHPNTESRSYLERHSNARIVDMVMFLKGIHDNLLGVVTQMDASGCLSASIGHTDSLCINLLDSVDGLIDEFLGTQPVLMDILAAPDISIAQSIDTILGLRDW